MDTYAYNSYSEAKVAYDAGLLAGSIFTNKVGDYNDGQIETKVIVLPIRNER